MTPTPHLSVVIPAYNEEIRISRTIREIVAYLSEQNYEWEIVVADDGSSDAHLPGLCLKQPVATREFGCCRWSTGARAGPSRTVCWPPPASSGCCPMPTCPSPSPRLSGCCRHRQRAWTLPLARGRPRAQPATANRAAAHLMGRVFNAVTGWFAATGLADTQCGFKCFRADAARLLFTHATLDGFSFDVEVLYLARRSGMMLAEIGVDWHYREHSKVRPFRDALSMTMDLLRIRWRHRGFSGR